MPRENSTRQIIGAILNIAFDTSNGAYSTRNGANFLNLSLSETDAMRAGALGGAIIGTGIQTARLIRNHYSQPDLHNNANENNTGRKATAKAIAEVVTISALSGIIGGLFEPITGIPLIQTAQASTVGAVENLVLILALWMLAAAIFEGFIRRSCCRDRLTLLEREIAREQMQRAANPANPANPANNVATNNEDNNRSHTTEMQARV